MKEKDTSDLTRELMNEADIDAYTGEILKWEVDD